MAILNFLNKKKKDESPSPVETFIPKVAPVRGPGGKFISKNKQSLMLRNKPEAGQTPHEDPKEKVVQNKFQGPFLAPFAGKEIKKYYANRKWYFSIEELIFLLSSNPPLEPLDQLKNNPKFKDLFEKEIRTIGGVDYTDCDGSIKILREIIKTYKANFPGSLFRWLEDISTHKLEKTENEEAK